MRSGYLIKGSATAIPQRETMDLETAYREHYRKVLNVCRRMLRSDDDAEDAAQEVFLHLANGNLAKFRGDSSFGTWVTRVTINLVLMRMRSKKRMMEVEIPEDDHCDAMVDPGRPFSALLIDRERVREAMSELPDCYQRALHLHDMEGYTHEEIGEMFFIHTGTSKSNLFKARAKMRKLLEV